MTRSKLLMRPLYFSDNRSEEIQHFGSHTNYQDVATEKVDIMSEKVKKDVLSKLNTAFIGVFRKVNKKCGKIVDANHKAVANKLNQWLGR